MLQRPPANRLQSRTVAALSLGVASLGLLAGCGFFKSLVGTNTVDLENAQVESMAVDIRQERKTLCPRQRVQMAVFMKVKLAGASEVSEVETYQGEESMNDRLDFTHFAFHSELGSFDEGGWFTPEGDLTKTLGSEFSLKTVFKKRPDKFSFESSYKPDYHCIAGVKLGAVSGPGGASGPTGKSGDNGSYGGSDKPGGQGTDGQPGGAGGNGGDGADGPKLEVWATWVKTPFYEKLLALRVGGSASDLLLAHPDQVLTLSAFGGSGGPGGRGGDGGRGGSGGSGAPGGNGGQGSTGGSGGQGGNGGRGGNILLHVDARYPELAKRLRLVVSGGAGGAPGPSGTAGRGGSEGSASGSEAARGTAGADGQSGQAGAGGSPGPDGRAETVKADVSAQFQGITGLTVLGDAESPEAPGEPTAAEAGSTP